MANRISNRARQAPRTQAEAAATMGDNSKHREEEERVMLISFIAKATKTAAEIEVVRAPFDAAKKAHNQVFSLAKAASPTFTRKYLEKKMEEMNRSPSENAEAKAMEARHDRWLGILTPEQQKMHLEPGTPQEARDEVDWEARGYSQGLRGMSPTLPEGIPPRMDQPFMKGHGIGYGEYRKALEANVPGKSRLAQQAEADFQGDNPEVDVDAAARKLKNSAFMESNLNQAQAFEATPEELAAQVTRPDRSEEVV